MSEEKPQEDWIVHTIEVSDEEMANICDLLDKTLPKDSPLCEAFKRCSVDSNQV